MKKTIISLLLLSTQALAQTPANDPLLKALESQNSNPPQQVPNFRQQNQIPQAPAQNAPAAAPQAPAAAAPVAAPAPVVAATPAPAKPKATPRPEPLKISKEESDLLKTRFRPLKDRPDLMQDEDAAPQVSGKSPIYIPSQARDKTNDGYMVDRDSTKVVKKKVSVNDALTVKICFSSGVQITLDESIRSTFQTVILDDPVFFAASTFDNNRGAFVRMKVPVPEGGYVETALRLIRKDDDKTYLINLIGLPCPAGIYPYPKTIYLQDKLDVFNNNTKVLTPEDTIISMSQGLPRIKKNRIVFYDMVTSSGSKWAVFGVEVQFPNRKSKKFTKKELENSFRILDNLQVQEIASKVEYLPIPSDKATKSRGISTMRFKVTMNIDKGYMLNNRFIYLMYIDKEEGHYQYVPVDTLPYFLSLKNRGFEL